MTSETICFVCAIDAIRTARQTLTRLDIWNTTSSISQNNTTQEQPPLTRAPEKEQVIRTERCTEYKFTWKICKRTLFNTTGLVQIGLFVEEVADITGYAFRYVIIIDGDTIHARRDTRETHSRRDVAVRRIGTEAHTFTGKFVQRT